MPPQVLPATTAPNSRLSPMWVMSVRDVISLKSLPTHEDAMRDGKLVKWHEGMGAVWFVSQTWLRHTHPDDEIGSKCSMLTALLQKGLAGKLEISPNWSSAAVYPNLPTFSGKQLRQELDNGFVWFDIFSVPQEDKQLSLIHI